MTDQNRRHFLTLAMYTAAGTFAGFFTGCSRAKIETEDELKYEDLIKMEWGFIVDTTRCIGCGACVRACKNENGVPDGYYRTWVERYEITDDGEVRVDSPSGAINSFKETDLTDKALAKSFFVPKLCNHCRNSACTQVCPVGASFDSPDGVVLIDKTRCVGCGYCVQACPYGCRYLDHSIGTADKCTLCYHRIHKGLSPACVTACPRNARIIGDLKNINDPIHILLRERRFSVLKPEMGTNPKCYYIGLDMEVV